MMQLKIEREALKKEKDTASKDRLAKLEKEIVNLEEKANALARALAGREGQARRRRQAAESSSTPRASSWSRRSARAISPRPASSLTA